MTKEEMLKGIETCEKLIQILRNQISGKSGFFLPGEDRKAQIKHWEKKICEHEKTISHLNSYLKKGGRS